jgi:serine/threonine-protein kinase HipA
MHTLCQERPGVYVTNYTDVALILNKHSAAPAEDVSALFRHMVFNAAIGNVDDHLKNFWMLVTPSGYRLAPAFDLVPDISARGEHTLAFKYRFACPTRSELLEIADEWRVAAAATSIDSVVTAATAFSAIAREIGVRPGKSLHSLAADVDRRLDLLAG